jgi:hypothetical protein
MLLVSMQRSVTAVVAMARPTTIAAGASSNLLMRHFSDAKKVVAKKSDADGAKQKQSKGKKKTAAAAGSTGRPRDVEILLKCLDAPSTVPPPADAQESARRENILKNYNIGRFQQHNEHNHDLSCMLRMKMHAIKMLPKGSILKEKALEIDDVGPPRWRNIPAWTAPIPGFNPNEFVYTDE